MGSKKLLLSFVFVIGLLPGLTSAADLLTIYQQAQVNDPTIQAAREAQLATQQQMPQAAGQFLPVLSANATHTAYHQSATNSFSSTNTTTTSSINQGALHYNQSVYGLTVTQPVFYYQQWVQLKTASAQVKEANATYAAAEQDLIVRTVQAYFNVLKASDTLKFSKANKKALAKILEQAQLRFKVGLIPNTDVQIAKAQYDSAVAQEIADENTLANQKEILREINGYPVDTFSFARENMPLKNPEPANLERWVQTACEQNFTLQAARFSADVAKTQIQNTKASHLPTLNINGNLNRNTSVLTTPSTTSSNVGLQVSLPIFSGGTVTAKARQATHLYEQTQKQMEAVYRKTESSTRQAYRGVLTQISQIGAQKQAILSSESALKATEASFTAGTRTIVDVLNAQTNLIRSQQDYANARYNYIIQTVLLKQAAGTLSPLDVQHINTWLTAK